MFCQLLDIACTKDCCYLLGFSKACKLKTFFRGNLINCIPTRTTLHSFETSAWTSGTPLPSSIRYPSTVQLDGTFLVVGGGNNLIYQYDPVTGDWILLPVTLSESRMFHTALMVPASIFPPCNTLTM